MCNPKSHVTDGLHLLWCGFITPELPYTFPPCREERCFQISNHRVPRVAVTPLHPRWVVFHHLRLIAALPRSASEPKDHCTTSTLCSVPHVIRVGITSVWLRLIRPVSESILVQATNLQKSYGDKHESTWQRDFSTNTPFNTWKFACVQGSKAQLYMCIQPLRTSPTHRMMADHYQGWADPDI